MGAAAVVYCTAPHKHLPVIIAASRTIATSSRPATKAGASRTAPELQEAVPHATALAPAPQPRPVPPGRALPVVQARRGVNFERRSAVNFARRLTPDRS